MSNNKYKKNMESTDPLSPPQLIRQTNALQETDIICQTLLLNNVIDAKTLHFLYSYNYNNDNYLNHEQKPFFERSRTFSLVNAKH
jgi:hypothetical protein